MEIFRVEDLNFTYPLHEKPALQHINLTVEEGEFITLCGKSGCGKSTLLRQLKPILAPHGEKTGAIYFKGASLEQVDQRTQASEIGYVLQNPDNQIVTDKVWHELAFGLESLGYDTPTIRLRVAEMASFFGIQRWFRKSVTELSGGQKQLLNLASIMAMQPTVLILDEPTSQLDPIAASDFLETVKKINLELGTTIIITEHRLEEVLPMSDRVIVMDKSEIIADDTPKAAAEKLKKLQHDMFLAMPSPMQIYAGVPNELTCPITVREGRQWLDELFANREISKNKLEQMDGSSREYGDVVIKLKDIWYRYAKDAPDVVRDLSLEIREGQMFCLVGGNGTGKTTSMSIIAGILRPYRGKVFLNGVNVAKLSNKEKFNHNLAMLPQNPQSLFVKKTVRLDLMEVLTDKKLNKEDIAQRVQDMAELIGLEDLLEMHPYDLSGGEQQRVALGKVLLLEPKILLLDEPTKGLDGYFKLKLADIFQKLLEKKVTIVMVSHDVEFCARYGDVCAMFFDGNIVTSGKPRQFFSGNNFYTTAANRMSRHLFPGAVISEDVIQLCLDNLS